MSTKWNREQVTALIDAYKDEECLYAVGSANYHNKHLRRAALERVGEKVRNLRPLTTDQECLNKFHALRTQFNVENSKVKKSLKSGTGADNVYTPNLWYFEQLLFLESFYVPKKSKNSLESFSNIKKSERSSINEANMTAAESLNSDSFIGEFNVVLQQEKENCQDASENLQELMASCSSNDSTDLHVAKSTVSTSSNITSVSATGSSVKRKRAAPDPFVSAVETLADSLRAPVVLNSSISTASPPVEDNVSAFLCFLGSILRSMGSEESKLQLIIELTEVAFKYKKEEKNL